MNYFTSFANNPMGAVTDLATRAGWFIITKSGLEMLLPEETIASILPDAVERVFPAKAVKEGLDMAVLMGVNAYL